MGRLLKLPQKKIVVLREIPLGKECFCGVLYFLLLELVETSFYEFDPSFLNLIIISLTTCSLYDEEERYVSLCVCSMSAVHLYIFQASFKSESCVASFSAEILAGPSLSAWMFLSNLYLKVVSTTNGALIQKGSVWGEISFDVI